MSQDQYIALDVGCIECGELSHVLGIFDNKTEAEAICRAAEAVQRENWKGQHSFEVLTVENPYEVAA
jgi:hypothetical protein